MSGKDETPGAPAARGRILVWDAPVRVFHWLMVLCFATAWVTGDSDRWALLHITAGYTMGGLVVFRLVWGAAGTRYARFAAFVTGPGTVIAYVRDLLARRPQHHVGHNPAGALAIVALLALTAVVTATGWALQENLAGHWLEEFHEASAEIMLVVVGIHIAGVIVSSWLHRENLVRAMIPGRKAGVPDEGIPRSRRILAALLLIAVLAFWGWTWLNRPAAGADADSAARPTHTTQA